MKNILIKLTAILFILTISSCSGSDEGNDTDNPENVKTTQRNVLIDIYNLNPNNTLGWDITTENIGDWKGVDIENNYVTHLEISYNGIKNIPKSIHKLTNLKVLFLSGGGVTNIPSEIGQLTQLERLNMGDNEISTIPDEIMTLTNLIALDFQINKITSISNKIKSLTNLKKLNFRKNQISSIPSEIGHLTQLNYLDFASNKLTAVPKDIGNLTKLDYLNFKGNIGLTSLPSEICALNIPSGNTNDYCISQVSIISKNNESNPKNKTDTNYPISRL